ncbi:flagellar hook assembly protein FlgD [Oceanibacterium hippocampi]|uniref:Basal-body rod modification protein FlgD n=1 Tax=Oceanibacterium hippocampi TaxID=745714 RepID=A0A1Y5TQI6_9PROT|nr:flagellar hook assembly protein FlgD [Oceanibacterium hippocampi]SLN69511.1 Basal-body rod modification protein FlgD [Oceanibacterium hippocampi]
MEVSALSPTAYTSKADTSAANLAENFDDFLILLTTQLQNQDPLEPLDSNEFTQQLVQFTNVEQAIQQNKNLEALIELSGANQALSQATTLVSYVGKAIEANGNEANLSGGTATWNYEMPPSAHDAQIRIYDEFNNLVYRGAAVASGGTHSFTWDGTGVNENLQPTGVTHPDGAYRIDVTATDADGAAVDDIGVFVRGVVTGVENDEGTLTLLIGKAKVDPGGIRSVHLAEDI